MAASMAKTSKHGGKYCVAGGPNGVSCKNSSFTEGISLHMFPKQKNTGTEADKEKAKTRARWIQFVRRHRRDFEVSSTYVLCSVHFHHNCFTKNVEIAGLVGNRRRLLAEAVPTIDIAGPGVPTETVPASTARARRQALDYLAIGVHELASMSERRTERLVNPALSDLPAFLVQDGGLNSGFMIAHCTAAALVSENKALCHPSSVDSLSTSAATEDHVSMGGWAARKALRVVEHVEQVLAIELLAACQALEFLRPLKTTAPLEGVHQLLRSVVSPWDRDRVMSPDIEAAHALIREQKLWKTVQPFMEEYRKKLTT